MNAGLKITAFAAALTATFGATYGLGGTIDPMTTRPPASHTDHTGGGQRTTHDDRGDEGPVHRG